MKSMVILGSTGSIGTQALDVARLRNFTVKALTSNSNIDLLEKQIREFKPEIAAVADENRAAELRIKVADTDTKVLGGEEGICAAAQLDADKVLNSIVGIAGLKPTLAAIEAGNDIALANKETLVAGGELVTTRAKEKGVAILPVDSEHSAIFQSLQGSPGKQSVKRLILTASGGPFFGRTCDDLKDVTVEQALKHPNWTMGRKITIDSSTMVNKGLEVMEARWLFGVEMDQIQVVVQPQSVIHSMVQFADGAVIAQLGTPDMKLPIQYALYYPERRFLPGERLDFAKLGSITFEDPDMEVFRGLKLAYRAGKRGGSLPTVYNAANEYAVGKFLNREISYLTIIDMIEGAMEHHKVVENPNVDEILAAERGTYEYIESRW